MFVIHSSQRDGGETQGCWDRVSVFPSGAVVPASWAPPREARCLRGPTLPFRPALRPLQEKVFSFYIQ